MESNLHTLCELFRQLGLPDDLPAMERFIAKHRPLDRHIKLSEAPFWSQAQRDFLCQAIKHDADWAELVDQLDSRLR
ncbi:MAG TPA: DUF2789 domain-containing protein [Candidatus Acidoferrum sp.]|nr:DUF2789 domain-containing protein [Candidatus Acidoferrum sp.]